MASNTNGGRTALITGGAGFIGSHLAESLLDKGYRVTIIDNLSTGRIENIAHLTENPSFHFAVDDITSDVVMDRLVSECDVIFHMAAAVGVQLIVNDPVHVIETNVLGTHAVLKAANRYRKKVLIASTSEIYGKSENVPFGEDDDRLLGPTTKARWSYSTSKAVDEFLGLAYHQQLGLPIVIFRLFNTVGPRQTGQYGMVVPRFAQQAIDGDPITVYGDGKQTRCFCDVRDTVRAIVALSESQDAIGRVFNIGSTEEISITDLAKLVLRQAGRSADMTKESIRFVPYELAYGSDFEDMRRRVPDTSRIQGALGWQPEFTLETTIGNVIASLRQRHAVAAS